MAWNYLQAEIVADDHLVRPMIGPGELTRTQAAAEIQGLLDRVPALADTAAIWRRGAKDDTLFHGPFIWAIYEHPDGQDPRVAAVAWAEDLAATMRAAGLDVQVAHLP